MDFFRPVRLIQPVWIIDSQSKINENSWIYFFALDELILFRQTNQKNWNVEPVTEFAQSVNISGKLHEFGSRQWLPGDQVYLSVQSKFKNTKSSTQMHWNDETKVKLKVILWIWLSPMTSWRSSVPEPKFKIWAIRSSGDMNQMSFIEIGQPKFQFLMWIKVHNSELS